MNFYMETMLPYFPKENKKPDVIELWSVEQ